MSVALASGSDTGSASRRVITCIHPAAGTWIKLSEFATNGTVSQTLEMATQHGIPVRELLLSAAATKRTHMHAQLEAAAERMGVAVFIPLGVCILPAFIAIGVVPVIASLVLQLFD